MKKNAILFCKTHQLFIYLDSDDEIKIFAGETQQYLIKEAYYTLFENVVGTKKLDLTSLGLVSNWMWFLQRDDVSKRNQWSNYSNWPYKNPPNPPIPAGKQNASPFKFFGSDCNYPPDTLYNSGFYSPIYDKQILYLRVCFNKSKKKEKSDQEFSPQARSEVLPRRDSGRRAHQKSAGGSGERG